MPERANLDEIVASAQRVLAHVSTVCDSWRFPSSPNQAVATAGMVRATELIDEALDLATRRRSVGANVLVRSAFEYWLVGAWALFGGDDALIGIERERIRNERILVGAVEMEDRDREHIDRQARDLEAVANRLLGGDAPSSVKLEAMARALPPLIKAQTPDGEEADVLAIYNLFYRSHSTYDAHPWKVLGQYVTNSGLGVRVLPVGPWQDPRISSASMTMYVAVLGRWIDRPRGQDGATWDEAASELTDRLGHRDDTSGM